MSAFTWFLPPPRQLIQGKRSFRNQQVFIQSLLRARKRRGPGVQRERGAPSSCSRGRAYVLVGQTSSPWTGGLSVGA